MFAIRFFYFFSITKERTEVIFQGTTAENPSDPNAVWLEYEFKCKPGNCYNLVLILFIYGLSIFASSDSWLCSVRVSTKALGMGH